jgi:hypothetical protein
MVKVSLGDLKPMFKNEVYNWGSNEKKKLYVSIVTNGFITKRNGDNIKITKDLHIIDGNHRLEILKRIHSDDYQIMVEEWPIKRVYYLIVLTFLLVIFSPFSKSCRTAINKMLNYRFKNGFISN